VSAHADCDGDADDENAMDVTDADDEGDVSVPAKTTKKEAATNEPTTVREELAPSSNRSIAALRMNIVTSWMMMMRMKMTRMRARKRR
jgi:hypothetical protein